ncbi:unnamed protein product [Spirodela intermedia]|uniref:Glutaredoxin domain-containing protein n=1 Tax=Spirodela intermedia TaxID=51605 RepID=A0A7I8K484_SPIIN|nr:unnamed protein product [Spirodela intermedia]
MGCASSRFLKDEDGGVIVGAGIGHHIVSLTSTTYGLLTTLDQSSTPTDLISTVFSPSRSPHPPPPPPPPPRPLVSSRFHLRSATEPEVINSRDIMASFYPNNTPPSRSPLLALRDPITRIRKLSPNSKPLLSLSPGKENFNSNRSLLPCFASVAETQERKSGVAVKLFSDHSTVPRASSCYALEMFPRRCPPGGENAAVIYTTTLRGIRKTYEDCSAVRAALQGLGVWFKERDVSMDMGFRQELRELLKGLPDAAMPVTLPRLFVRARYIGGPEEVLRIHEEGGLEKLLDGLPRAQPGHLCDGCCGDRFLPCFRCNGGRKLVALTAAGGGTGNGGCGGGIVRCPECNENGLVPCPLCR